MTELSREDVALVLEVVLAVNQAGDRTSFMRTALRQAVLVVPCLTASLNEVGPGAGRFNLWAEPESFPLAPEPVEAFAELAAGHPVVRYYQRTGDGSVRAISDFWDEDVFHRSELYRRVYGPLGVEHQISIILPAPRPTVLGLAINRSDEDFSARDRLVMNTLRPYLAQAWRTASDRERVTSMLEAATTAIGQAGYGAAVLTDPPEELTTEVFAQLARAFGGPGANGPLPDAVRHWLAGLVSSGKRRLELRPPLVSDGSAPRVVVRYLSPEGNRPGALVVREIGRLAPGRFEALGLSVREAEVANLVVSGQANESVARQLNISAGTVKKHLDNIYSKLSVRSRGQLTALVLDMA